MDIFSGPIFLGARAGNNLTCNIGTFKPSSTALRVVEMRFHLGIGVEKLHAGSAGGLGKQLPQARYLSMSFEHVCSFTSSAAAFDLAFHASIRVGCTILSLLIGMLES